MIEFRKVYGDILDIEADFIFNPLNTTFRAFSGRID